MSSSRNFAGSLDYTLDEEAHGREIDIRLYYNWEDYNRADEPFPVWGATIEEFEILGARRIDESDTEALECVEDDVSKVAQELVNDLELTLIEACTEDGYHKGVGEAPPSYSPPPILPVSSNTQSGLTARMAGSLSTRNTEQQRRRFG